MAKSVKTPPTAETNLFSIAKATGATASDSPGKPVAIVNDPKFHLNVTRLAELNAQIQTLTGEAQVIAAEVKEQAILEFSKLFTKNGKYPGSFLVRATGMKKMNPGTFMFIPTDNYLKLGKERYAELVGMFGDSIAEERTVYELDAKLVEEKYGPVLSKLINESKLITPDDKLKLIKASTTFAIKKGTISKLDTFGLTVAEMVEEVKPIFQTKNVRVEEP